MSGVVVLTGAAGGIGRVLSRALVDAGYAVAALDIDGAEQLAAELEAAGATAFGVAADVTDRSSVESAIGAVCQRFGRIDALVNNAAHYTGIVKTSFESIDVDEWDTCFAVNVRGAWLCAAAVAPTMRAQGRGKIVNVSSMTVPTAPPGFAHYVASKAAIVGLTRALARELGESGVCVNTLTPDYIAFDREYDNRQPEMAPMLTAQRVLQRDARAEDLTGTLLYLLGDASDFVTGQNIWVNGGRAFI